MLFHDLRVSKEFTTFIVCVAVFSDVLLQGLIVAVLPYALRERVGLTDEVDVQRWNSLLLSAGAGTSMLGSLGISAIADQIPSHRTPFLLSLVLAFTSTIYLALGTTIPVLLFARLLEGLSTAIVATVGYALMCEAVGQENLGCATDFSSMSVRMGLLLGPVMGGLLYEYEGHFETFLPALVLVGAEVALRMLIIEDKKRDVTSASENTGAESGMENGTEKTGNPIKAGAIAATETQPLLRPPPRPTAPQNTIYRILLTNRAFLASLAAIFIHTSTTSAFSAILPPYISSTFALGPLPASILILTLILPTLYPPLTIALTSHFGTEHVALTGLAIGAPSLAALSLVGPGTASPMLKLGFLFLLIGIALALTLVPLQLDAAVAVAAIAEQRPRTFSLRGAYVQAFGLVNAIVAAGGVVGPLAAGSARIWIGWEGMAVAMGGLSLLIFGSVVVCMNGRKV